MPPFRFQINTGRRRNPEEHLTLLQTLSPYQPVATFHERPSTDERPLMCKLCACCLFLLLSLPIGVAVYVSTHAKRQPPGISHMAMPVKRSRTRSNKAQPPSRPMTALPHSPAPANPPSDSPEPPPSPPAPPLPNPNPPPPSPPPPSDPPEPPPSPQPRWPPPSPVPPSPKPPPPSPGRPSPPSPPMSGVELSDAPPPSAPPPLTEPVLEVNKPVVVPADAVAVLP